MKKLLLSLSALLLLAALVFTGIYFTRFQSMAALQKITDYSDGYNLYRMDIRYRYSLNDLLARGITDYQSMVDAILEEALPLLDRKLPGFAAPDAVMTAPETRSSSPVRIVRDPKTRQSVSIGGLYPCGEGAGYAGGIMSAAVDGIMVAETVIQSLNSDEKVSLEIE